MENHDNELNGVPQNIEYMVIGLTGPLGAGKGTVANELSDLMRGQNINVIRLSLSDFIREEINRRGTSSQRDSQKETGDWFRQHFWSGILGDMAVSELKARLKVLDPQKTLFLVDGIRTPGEVNTLRSSFGDRFRLLGITALKKNLIRNLQERNREDESKQIFDDRTKLEQLIDSEMGSPETRNYGHNVAACLEMVDWPVIHNDKELSDLQESVGALAERYIFPWFVNDK